MPKPIPETASQASLRARHAAQARWSRPMDRQAALANATAASPASRAYWEAKLNPDGTLDPAMVRQAAESARKAYFTKLAYNSSRARQSRRQVAS